MSHISQNCQICWDMIRQLLRSGEAAIQKSEHCGNSYGKVWQSKTISTDLLIEKLNHLDDLFRVWYSSLGFRYASQEKITQRMFLYTVTQELGKEPSCSCVPKEFRKYMDEWGIVPINKREDWDIFEDQFHDELLDTDQNRKNLENLYEKYLPGFRIWKFESHRNDYGHFVLRHTVYVPFEAIEDLEKQR